MATAKETEEESQFPDHHQDQEEGGEAAAQGGSGSRHQVHGTNETYLDDLPDDILDILLFVPHGGHGRTGPGTAP